jgi:hypothetical protein
MFCVALSGGTMGMTFFFDVWDDFCWLKRGPFGKVSFQLSNGWSSPFFLFFGSEVPLLRMHHDGKVGPFLNLVNLVSDFGVSSCKLRRLLTANEESELGPWELVLGLRPLEPKNASSWPSEQDPDLLISNPTVETWVFLVGKPSQFGASGFDLHHPRPKSWVSNLTLLV